MATAFQPSAFQNNAFQIDLGPAPAPVPFPRLLSGKVFVIDAVQGYFFGPSPNLGESCALVFYVGTGLPTYQAPLLFTFVRPDGTLQIGDPRFGFIGQPDVGQRYLPNFPAGQYVVYLFGIGELSQRGAWQVSVITTDYFSNAYSFTVN